ncbi:MAG TPA: hypothetical protein PK566_10265 [Pseudobacteroides sp.]|nr:hypothetical protein [Pseudobacteroides sp.]
MRLSYIKNNIRNLLYLGILSILLIAFFTGCDNSDKDLIQFQISETGSNDISLNGQNYSAMENFIATDEGEKVGYAQFASNGSYDIYEIKGQSINDWILVKPSDEPGLTQWVCKNDSINLTLDNFETTEIKIMSLDERSTKATINNKDDIDSIVKAATSGAIVEDLVGSIDGKDYFLYFISSKYPGIAYREGLVISKDSKYYYHQPGNKYIDVTDILKKFINDSTAITPVKNR